MSGNLSLKQQSVLSKLRQQLQDEKIIHEGDTMGTTDHDLLRFLCARNFDLEQSKDMIIECQQWRRTALGVGIDAIYESTNVFDIPDKDILFTHWPIFFHKTDKLGRPLFLTKLGGINLPALYTEISPKRLREILAAIAESIVRDFLPACSRSSGKLIETGIVIVDLKGFSLTQFWHMKDLIQDQFQIAQDYYPEVLGKIIFINAPTSFTYAWSVIKLWLSKETISKIDILDSEYKDALLELIYAESLPAMYGGTCQCEGAGGCTMSGVGPWQAEKSVVELASI